MYFKDKKSSFNQFIVIKIDKVGHLFPVSSLHDFVSFSINSHLDRRLKEECRRLNRPVNESEFIFNHNLFRNTYYV